LCEGHTLTARRNGPKRSPPPLFIVFYSNELCASPLLLAQSCFRSAWVTSRNRPRRSFFIGSRRFARHRTEP